MTKDKYLTTVIKTTIICSNKLDAPFPLFSQLPILVFFLSLHLFCIQNIMQDFSYLFHIYRL